MNMPNDETNVPYFIECKRVVQVDNNEVTFFFGMGTARTMSMVDGVKH